MISYRVRLGRLLMDITLLNVDLAAEEVSCTSLTKGSFGEVFIAPNSRIPCISKRITLDGSWHELASSEGKWFVCSSRYEI